MDDLIPFDEARRIVIDHTPVLLAERVVPVHAVGRFMARDITSPEDLPRNPISAMDGYALPAALVDIILQHDSGEARVVGEVAAGSSGHRGPVGPSDCVRIFTGGMVPGWAKAVVMQEQCSRHGNDVTIRGPVEVGQYIRKSGGDVKAGQIVLSRGDPFLPPCVAIASALGIDTISVGRQPVVGILVTGSEIQAGPDLQPGQIRDSNGPTLEAAATACGAASVHRVDADDTKSGTAGALSALLGEVDVLCVSGGVSVGDYDIVKEVLEELGVLRVFWRVAQRPGKPLYFGLNGEQPVFGLPGNPASALATFLAHVWPVLRKLQGASEPHVTRRAVLAQNERKHEGFTAMLRGRRSFDGPVTRVETAGGQDSHLMTSFAASDCLILGPPEYTTIPKDTEVDVIPYPWGSR